MIRLIWIALIVFVGTTYAASIYSYDVVAKSGSMVAGRPLTYIESASLNNHGDVVFKATFPGGSGVFTSSMLISGTGSSIAGQILTDVYNPVVSDTGEVAWYAGTTTGEGIFSSNGTAVMPGSTIGGKTLDGLLYWPAISDSGSLAFIGFYSTGSSGVFSPTAHLAGSGSVISGMPIDGIFIPWATLSVNNSVEASFIADTSAGPALFTNQRYIAGPGSIIPQGELTHINGYSVINNSGVVAYSGGGDFGGGIFTTAGRSVLRGESLHDIEIYGLSAILDLNDSGNVLFLHFDPAGAEALMTFDGVIARSGQQLAGGTVQNLMPFGLNNRGQVLFGAYLTSGVSTLVLATPVPEPATYTTAVTALVVIAGARRRRMEAARTKNKTSSTAFSRLSSGLLLVS